MRLYPSSINGKCGYINENGDVCISPQWDGGAEFLNGRAVVRVGKRFGAIDMSGDLVIGVEFERLGRSEGQGTHVYSENQKRGLVSDAGIVMKAAVDAIADYSEGTFPFCVGDKWGYLDIMGHVEIGCDFDDAVSFSCGCGRVELGGRCGFVGRSGDFVIDPVYSDSSYRFSSGSINTVWLTGEEGDTGILDDSGSTIVPFRFGELDNFHEDLAYYQEGRSFGYLGLDGSPRIPARFLGGYAFHDGLAAVLVADGWCQIDHSGEVVIEPSFSDGGFSFRNGFCLFERAGGLGIIDKDGNVIMDSVCKWIDVIDSEMARVTYPEDGGAYYYNLRQRRIVGRML